MTRSLSLYLKCSNWILNLIHILGSGTRKCSKDICGLWWSGEFGSLSLALHGLPCWLSGKESACSAGARGGLGSIPEWGRSPGGGYGNPLQYSGWENPMDRGAWWATITGLQRVRRDSSDLVHMHACTWLYISNVSFRALSCNFNLLCRFSLLSEK